MAKRVFISPGKYVQGPKLIDEVGTYLKDYGKKALVIADKFVFKIAGDNVMRSLEINNIATLKSIFNGESSNTEIGRITELAKIEGIDIIVGVGGGKTIDTTKAIADNLTAVCAIVPTVASTDAPTSALSVIYTEEGIFEAYRFYKKNPDIVLVDTEIIANAPARFLSSGIADALATWVEVRAAIQSNSVNMAGGLPTIAAEAIAKRCEEVLFLYGKLAYESVKRQNVSKALETVVEANTLLSGLGFESGGLAAAHAIHNGFTVLDGDIHHLTHGEKVAYGTLAQLVLENRDQEELERYLDLYISLDLPVTLEDLKLENVTKQQLYEVGVAATKETETMQSMPFKVTPDDVVQAIIAVDQYAKLYKKKLG